MSITEEKRWHPTDATLTGVLGVVLEPCCIALGFERAIQL